MSLLENKYLQEILSSGEVRHPSGKIYKLTSATSVEEAHAMYRLIRENRPVHIIEIGMAYGVSALTILSALSENREGKLLSIDPYPKWESARETALSYIERAGFSKFHKHIHASSELALPRLVEEGFVADFIYIDGHHGFDHVFVDFFYSDLLLQVGGVLAFDDSAWQSVHKVIKYLLRHREYCELDVGLKKQWRGRNLLGTGLRRMQGRYGSSRYFKKVGTWTPPYNFYKAF